MSIVAIIPARSGSKRLPGKNTKILAGKPLIGWTIEAALNSGVFSEVIVSTDSPEIADIAFNFGATVPFIRPKELSTDLATSASVVKHALNYTTTGPSSCALLQPTSPLRDSSDIANAVDVFKANQTATLVTVFEMHEKMNWLFEEREDGQFSRLSDSFSANKLLAINGAIYLFDIERFKSTEEFISDGCSFSKMSIINSIDIDTPEEFEIAEMYMKYKNRSQKHLDL